MFQDLLSVFIIQDKSENLKRGCLLLILLLHILSYSCTIYEMPYNVIKFLKLLIILVTNWYEITPGKFGKLLRLTALELQLINHFHCRIENNSLRVSIFYYLIWSVRYLHQIFCRFQSCTLSQCVVIETFFNEITGNT